MNSNEQQTGGMLGPLGFIVIMALFTVSVVVAVGRMERLEDGWGPLLAIFTTPFILFAYLYIKLYVYSSQNLRQFAESEFMRGVQHGNITGVRDMMLRVIEYRFGSVPEYIVQWSKQVNDVNVLASLLIEAVTCVDIEVLSKTIRESNQEIRLGRRMG